MYNIDGYRIKKVNKTKEGHYIINLQGKVLEEIDITKSQTVSSVFLKSRHLARVSGDETLYYGLDHQGTTVLVTDETGQAVWSAESSPFGDHVMGGIKIREDLKLKYTGKDYDEDTDLYYFNARWYDASTGRFITEDPARDGQNWYTYTFNNPLKYIDPTGLAAYDDAPDMSLSDQDKEEIRNNLKERERRNDGATPWAQKQFEKANKYYEKALNARTSFGRRWYESKARMHHGFGIKSVNRSLGRGDGISESTMTALNDAFRGYYNVTAGGIFPSPGSENGYDTYPGSSRFGRPGQYDQAYGTDMNQSGCHFLAAMGVAHTAAGIQMETSTVNFIKELAQDLGFVTDNMSVNGSPNVVGVIDLGLMMLESDMKVRQFSEGYRFEGANASIIFGSTIIDLTGEGNHYHEGDGFGNPIWDSVRNDSEYINGFQPIYDYRTRFFRIR